ncbi:MAG: protein translocase subunit SecD [Bauldia sp.]|uniref:protein translocase subunit SecD n=1 Tax=Bauldia sp. TaxID=2575872 RepID=UPI001D8F498C|nr:protein translocase subunit SecD [Bauldia sp.]MCB1495343.1 protein translocase subunit SecD [Bauldia sp.]
MLTMSRWRTVLIILTIVVGIILVIPNFFSRESLNSLPGWLPKNQIVLGLDLQGGAYLLYEVDRQDYVDKRLRTLVSDVRKAMLQTPRIGYTGIGIQGDGVQLRVRDLSQLDEVRSRLEELRNPLVSSLLGGGAVNEFDLTVSEDGLVRLSYSEEGLSQRVRGIVQQSIEVIGRRINELGTTEPSIQRQGEDRILVEAPGLGDPERLKAIVGQTALLTFHLVRETVQGAQTQTPTPGTITVPSAEFEGTSFILDEAPLMTGEDLVDAQASFDQQTSQPVVNFRLSTSGARKFAEVTQNNVGRQFAIVLDDEVISAPVIREPILGGSGQISGSFSVESANDLAILLRAGSLPAKLTIVEERSVGPGLGADSIEAGEIASIIGALAVGIFMIVVYGFFGLLANIAVVVNVILIFAVLSALGATLTLPGIAGIVLTIGTAVDSNVLIYERIREESNQGRSAVAAIDLGFKRALGTIVDANITTLIAALALLLLGSGPIRGFAVTYAIGIATTIFTAFTFTRLMIATWYHQRRPARIAL